MYVYVDKMVSSKIQRLIVYIVICIAGGMIFYQSESRISKIIVKHTGRNVKKFDDKLSVPLERLVKNR